MREYEIESVEGVGYLLFEKFKAERTRRIGEVFKNIQQAKQYLGELGQQRVKLVYHSAYEEMINV